VQKSINDVVRYKLKAVFGTNIKFNENLKVHSTLRVGGYAECFIKAKSIRKVVFLDKLAKKYNIPLITVGCGSNILFSDKGFNGIVLSLKELNDIKLQKNLVTVGAGVSINNLILFSKENNLGGLEYLYGIPASIGGAITMNASAFGINISDYIENIEIINNGERVFLQPKDCDFSYRHSKFLDNNVIITSASFKLKKQDIEESDKIISFCKQKRKEKPNIRTCGSVFKNPDNIPAGYLIEKANLKGYSIGGATVSKKHANFIETSKSCSALDVYLLIKYIQNTVKDKFLITLIPEVRFVGEF